ncbi:MAG: phosphatase PAP2 family protein [Actinomycetota bacterium]|nr:phosphatase PAP2 family protein [Actinomycetota bacterium]
MAVSVSTRSAPSNDPAPHNRPISVFWRTVDFTRNAALILGLYFAYAAVRRVTADDWATALSNGRTLLRIQSSLGLPSEASLQHAFFLPNPPIIRAANAFYMWGHFPITGTFMFWVWFKHRAHFGVIRNSIVTLTLSGLFLHIVYPLAPPRFFPSFGFVDTARDFGPNPYDLAAAKAANQIAAMPSLHVGWAVLVAISVIALCRSRWRFLALIHPAVTTSVVVLTANHYWADAIIAVILVLGAWVFTVRLARVGLFSFTSLPRKEDPGPRVASLHSSVGGNTDRS